jgi:UrcA family protein
MLYSRLVDAAERVCPRRGYVTELRQNREAQRCVTAAVEDAVKQVKNPRFAEVARSKMR